MLPAGPLNSSDQSSFPREPPGGVGAGADVGGVGGGAGAELGGVGAVELGGAEPVGAEPVGAEPVGVEPVGVEPVGAELVGAVGSTGPGPWVSTGGLLGSDVTGGKCRKPGVPANFARIWDTISERVDAVYWTVRAALPVRSFWAA